MTGLSIKRAYTRYYTDNRQWFAYVEWSDGSRTEGRAIGPKRASGLHMTALFARAARDGIVITHELWS